MDWLGDHQWAIWLGLAVVLAIGELATVDLVMLMLAIGAGAGAIVALFTDNWAIEVVVAVVVAVGLLALVRPGLIKGLHHGPELLVGPERLIGQRVFTPIGFGWEDPGQLKIDGELWRVTPAEGAAPIEPGQTLVVTAIAGATAIVAPLPEPLKD